GVSPATIRNEMVYLTKQGYLQKSHSSAGRLPTPMALKLYVNELMKEKELSVADEVSAKEKIWHTRDEVDELLAEISKVLADKSHALGISIMNNRRIFTAGYANLLSMPEFFDIQVTRQVFQLIEEVQVLDDIFSQNVGENQVQVIYGQELGNRNLETIGLIHTDFEIKGIPCRIGVIGSSRFDYPYMIPMLRYVRSLVQEMVE
ncbi:MAG: hypothetical protein COY81_04065, partial [Candidatus Pacebacteria bacterium CG_4_10_14_0_8_um_filter_43_12]